MPNEALMKWVGEQTIRKGDIEWERVHPLSPVAAEFWLSVFVKEVEMKAAFIDLSISYENRIYFAWKSFLRDLGLDRDGDK